MATQEKGRRVRFEQYFDFGKRHYVDYNKIKTGFFHQWGSISTDSGVVTSALIEGEDGQMYCAHPEAVKFFTDEEVEKESSEKMQNIIKARYGK